MAILVPVYPENRKGEETGMQFFDTAELRDFLPTSFGSKQYIQDICYPCCPSAACVPHHCQTKVTNLTDFAHLETILDSVGIRGKCYFNTGTFEDDLKISHSWAGDKINAV